MIGRVRQLARVAATALRDGFLPLRLARRAIGEHGAIQRTWELQSLVGMVRRLRPARVVEIGSYKGGTLFCWIAVARPDAHIVSVDLPADIAGFGASAADFAPLRPYLAPRQTLTAIVGDSHAPATLQRVREALGGLPVDLLYVDGDHSYAGVKADVEMYGPLVRPGGLIALHDIHESAMWPESQSHVYWAEIQAGRRTREFIAEPRAGSGMGIGVVVVQ